MKGPLKVRLSIVVTKNPNFYKEGVYSANSINEAIRKTENLSDKDIYVPSGGQINKIAMPRASRLEITQVKVNYECDFYFPNIDNNLWREEKIERFYLFDFVAYKRK